jgi:23S rRNA (cytosine1962-C5)-methyltransferase
MIEGPVVLSRKGEARVLRGHPWIFRSDISRAEGVTPGAVVRVHGPQGRALGFALYSSRSEIRLRMIERGETLSATFLRERLTAALRWREVVAPGVRTGRLVHGEGDGLPSLIVDRYGEFLVLQTLSQGTERLKPELVALLAEMLAPKGILERNDPRVRLLEGLEQKVALLHGEVPEIVDVEEGGIAFQADLWKGQKTGLFLDQRENHLMVRGYARGRVLDGFSYSGGFALQAAGVADEVVAVDVSAEALLRLESNAKRNGLANVRVREENVFDLLHELVARGDRFDTVILDPPAFAKS